jgi:D-sedoheptulose 7-phosphate isomerase
MLERYVDNLVHSLKVIDYCVIREIIDALEVVHSAKGVVYILGNGGSCATASHMANDLSVGLKLRGIRDFHVESLGDNSSVCTAIANDIGYENIFYAQLVNKLKASDLVIAISCSGNSANVLKAAIYAKDIGAKVVGLTGFDGGKLKEISDISFHIQTEKGEYGVVEDMHMILDHMLYSYYIALKPETKYTYTLK